MAVSTPQPERPNNEDRARFGRALSKAIDKSPMKVSQVVLDSGLSYNSIKAYRQGKKFPLPQNAAKLAEILNAPVLTRLAHIEAKCPECNKMFVVGTQKPRAFCSDTCYTTYYRRNTKKQRRNVLRRANRELKRHREAVRLHCLDCTGGEYLCEMADCELRPVSPLPLRKASHAIPPPVVKGPIARIAPHRELGIVFVRRNG